MLYVLKMKTYMIIFLLVVAAYSQTSDNSRTAEQKRAAEIAQKRSDINNRLDSFPLWGATWLVGKGNSDHSVYTSFSRSVPTHLIKATFPGKEARLGGEIKLQWANLIGFNYRSISNLINEAENQFQKNSISIPYSVWLDSTAAGKDTVMAMTRRTVQDTLWSCDEAFNAAVDRYGNKYSSLYVFGAAAKDSLGNNLPLNMSYSLGIDKNGNRDTLKWTGAVFSRFDRNTWLWHRGKPVAWGKRRMKNEDFDIYTVKMAGGVSDILLKTGTKDVMVRRGNTLPLKHRYKPTALVNIGSSGFIDYCDEEVGSCYEKVDCYSIKTPNEFFWQVHFFPVVKWYPRNPSTGTPFISDAHAMNFGQAYYRRHKSIENMMDRNARDYVFKRGSEILADSVGIELFHAISESLVQGQRGRQRDSLVLRKMSDSLGLNVVDTIEWIYYRKPYYSDSTSSVVSVQFRKDSLYSRGVLKTRISDNGGEFDDFYIDRIPDRMVRVDNGDVGRAIMRLYAQNNREDSLFGGMDSRCGGGWKNKDIDIGVKYRFPPALGYARLPDSLKPIYPIFKEALGYRSGGTFYELVMDSLYDERRYIYNGCPATEIADLNGQTASDLRGFIFRTPPLCDEASMANALHVLLEVEEKNYLNHPDDRKLLLQRIVQLGNALEERQILKKRLTAQQQARAVRYCPDTWEVVFRDAVTGNGLYAISYNDNLRNRFTTIKRRYYQ
jgi:hypothetical protein